MSVGWSVAAWIHTHSNPCHQCILSVGALCTRHIGNVTLPIRVYSNPCRLRPYQCARFMAPEVVCFFKRAMAIVTASSNIEDCLTSMMCYISIWFRTIIDVNTLMMARCIGHNEVLMITLVRERKR